MEDEKKLLLGTMCKLFMKVKLACEVVSLACAAVKKKNFDGLMLIAGTMKEEKKEAC